MGFLGFPGFPCLVGLVGFAALPGPPGFRDLPGFAQAVYWSRNAEIACWKAEKAGFLLPSPRRRP